MEKFTLREEEIFAILSSLVVYARQMALLTNSPSSNMDKEM